MTFERLPAYSGATVPEFDRLPARERERNQLPRAGTPSWVRKSGKPMRNIAFASVLLALCGCQAVQRQNVAPQSPAHRIVSLMPSFTEDRCAIGARRQIVGVSEFSNDVPCANGLPAVGNATSIDAERIVKMRADAVVGIPAQRSLTEPVRRAAIRTEFLADDSFDDIFADIEALGRLSGHDRQARALNDSLKARTRRLQRSVSMAKAPSVFVVIQAQPVWTVGPKSFVATLVSLAGGRNAVTDLSQPYAQYGAESLVRLQPDVIVATRDSGLTYVLNRQPWRSLRAVRLKRVYVLSDDALLLRPGPRYNEGLTWLIERFKQQPI